MQKPTLMSTAMAASVATILSAGAAPARAAGSTNTDVFTAQLTHSLALSNAFLVYRDTTADGTSTQIVPVTDPTGSLGVANSTDTITLTGSGFPDIAKDYMMLGMYNIAGNTIGGVFAAMDSTAGQSDIATGATFAQAFANSPYSETQIQNALLTSDTLTIIGFFDSVLPQGNNTIGGVIDAYGAHTGKSGATSKIDDFSNASDGGSVTISQSPVPEPTGLLALATTFLGLFGRRRK